MRAGAIKCRLCLNEQENIDHAEKQLDGQLAGHYDRSVAPIILHRRKKRRSSVIISSLGELELQPHSISGDFADLAGSFVLSHQTDAGGQECAQKTEGGMDAKSRLGSRGRTSFIW